MQQGLFLRELLCIDKCMGFKLLSGDIRKEQVFNDVIIYCSDTPLDFTTTKIEEAKKYDLLVALELDVDSCNIIELLMDYKDKISAIIMLKKEGGHLSKSFAECVKLSSIPVILLDNVSADELSSYIDIIINLKKIDQLTTYIAATNSYLFSVMNKHGIYYMWMIVEKMIQHSMFLFNHLLEPIPISENMKQDITNKQKEWQLLKTEFRKYKNKIDGIIDLEITISEGSKQWKLLKLEADSMLGYIGVSTSSIDSLDELDIVCLKRILPIVTAEFIKQRDILETKKLYKRNFLYDLLHNNLEGAVDVIITQGQIWGWDLTKSYQLLLVELKHVKGGKLTTEDINHIILLIKNILVSSSKTTIVEELHGQIVVMYTDSIELERKKHTEKVKNIANKIRNTILEEIDELQVIIGIGRFYPTTEQLCRCYQEAKTALDLSKYTQEISVMHFEDLGVMRLLTSIRNEQLDDFCKEYLSELMNFDKENNTELLRTLQLYFAENGNFKTTATKLFVHTNTLRYRLKKAEEILGVDLQKPKDFVNIYVATLIYNINS